MTINIGLATSDALVFGCDSVASATTPFLDPFGMKWEHDTEGKLLQDADGKFSLKFDFNDLNRVVTNAWGGVTKMFELHAHPSPIVGVTAGVAKLNERPIASYATDFFALDENRHLKSSNEIAAVFLKFMRAAYEEHYKGSGEPESIREGPEFLVGGYGEDEPFPSIYRIRVKENDVTMEFGPSGRIGRAGVSWNGQSDAVERFIRGYDGYLKRDIEQLIRQELRAVSEIAAKEFAAFVNDLLAKLGQALPEGTKFELPEMKASTIDWVQYGVSIDFANLPLQEAINFVGFLVVLQAGKSRFARGVPTVGGHVHVGVITKKDGFKPLEEPKLLHRLRGFTDDL